MYVYLGHFKLLLWLVLILILKLFYCSNIDTFFLIASIYCKMYLLLLIDYYMCIYTLKRMSFYFRVASLMVQKHGI